MNWGSFSFSLMGVINMVLQICLNELAVDGKDSRLNKITRKVNFSSFGKIKKEHINASYKFAYKMSFTEYGHHRRKRSGGIDNRKKVQIFCDTFNGKLGEFAVYQYFRMNGIKLPYPDVNVMGEGQWDSYDFDFEKNNKRKKIGIKTTKKKGQLLLLETKDWNENGQYMPNLNKGHADYDEILLVRVDSEIITDLKKEKLYFENSISKEKLREIARKSSYEFDVAGVVDTEMLKTTINNKNIIKQGDYLQSLATKMDAENYYIQAGDMYRVKDYINHLNNI